MHYYAFNIADYRKDTTHLTLVEHGIYRQLLDMYYIDEGPLPSKDRLMRLLCVRTADEERALDNVLSDFFVHDSESGYINKRCDGELKKIFEKSEKARKSAKARWLNYKEKEAEPMRTHSESSANGMLPKDLINPIPNNKTNMSDSVESNTRFNEFWEIYPRKANKKKAEVSWRRLSKTKQELAIEDIKTRYSGVDKQFIPLPTTYINGERWNDERIKTKPQRPEWATLPKSNDSLWPFAKKHGFSSPGSKTYDQYRQSLTMEIERRLQREGTFT